MDLNEALPQAGQGRDSNEEKADAELVSTDVARDSFLFIY
jgi:hypothetical protein